MNISWNYISSSQPWFYGFHLGKKFHKLEDVFGPINSPVNDIYSNPQTCSLFSKMSKPFFYAYYFCLNVDLYETSLMIMISSWLVLLLLSVLLAFEPSTLLWGCVWKLKTNYISPLIRVLSGSHCLQGKMQLHVSCSSILDLVLAYLFTLDMATPYIHATLQPPCTSNNPRNVSAFL